MQTPLTPEGPGPVALARPTREPLPERLERLIRAHPAEALLVCAAAGFLFGRALRLLLSRREAS